MGWLKRSQRRKIFCAWLSIVSILHRYIVLIISVVLISLFLTSWLVLRNPVVRSSAGSVIQGDGLSHRGPGFTYEPICHWWHPEGHLVKLLLRAKRSTALEYAWDLEWAMDDIKSVDFLTVQYLNSYVIILCSNVWWPSGYNAELVINRSQVWIPATPLSNATLGKLLTHMCLCH